MQYPICHKEFLSELKTYGFEITQHIHSETGSTQPNLYVNGVLIPKDQMKFFGYESLGTYNTCSRTKQEHFFLHDFVNSVRACSKILMRRIEFEAKVPSYHDCKDYLLDNHRTSKINEKSINRVLFMLKENYQDLIKSVKGFKPYN